MRRGRANEDDECINQHRFFAILFAGACVAMPLIYDASPTELVSAILLAMCLYLYVSDGPASERFGPTRFVVGAVDQAAALAVPAVQRIRAKHLTAGWFLLAAAVLHEWGRTPTSPRAAELSQPLNVGVVALTAIGLVAMTVRLLAGGPVVTLSRAGVRSRLLLGTWFVPWDALAPPPPRPFQKMTEHLQVSEPGRVRYRGLAVRRGRLSLPVGELRTVHPWFVYDAIAYYVEHPEHRHAIGEESEHERLRQALGAIEGSRREIGPAS